MYITEINGISLKIISDNGIFSPSQPDKGTLEMIKLSDRYIRSDENVKVLDLGCGCGIVGIYAAKIIGGGRVVMSDASETAIMVAKQNAAENGVPDAKVILSDGFSALTESGFSLILCNPPYHEDFSVPKHFIEKGFNRLIPGGRMIIVVKRREWYKNKLISIFGGVEITESGGYYIMAAEKRSASYAKNKKRR